MTVLAKMPKRFYQTMNDLTVQTEAERVAAQARFEEEAAHDCFRRLSRRVAEAREELAKFGATLQNLTVEDRALYHFEWSGKYFTYAAQIDIYTRCLGYKRDENTFSEWRQVIEELAVERVLERVSEGQSTSPCSNYANQVSAAVWKDLARGDRW